MTRRVREILEARFRERDRFTITEPESQGAVATQGGGDPSETESPLVFPGRTHVNPIKDLRALHETITTRTGLVATSHDLRRVFASAALREGVPQLVLKRLLNHLSGSRDVTAGYQISGLGDLRDASQLVEDHILGKAGLLPHTDGPRAEARPTGEDAETLIADLVSGLPEERRAAVLAALRGA
jgi:hypothetical protein